SVGLDWQLGGFAPNAPIASSGSMGDSSQVAQLAQAMAGFGGGSGAAESMNIAALGADTSQQPLLTTPQHSGRQHEDRQAVPTARQFLRARSDVPVRRS